MPRPPLLAPVVLARPRYAVLPQNLVSVEGTLREDFETTTGWTASNGTMANDAVNVKVGTQSIQLTGNVGAADVRLSKNISAAPWDLSNSEEIRFWIYVPDSTLITGGTFYVDLSNDSGYTKRFRYYAFFNVTPAGSGWKLISTRKADWSAAGGMTWSDAINYIRFRFNCVAGQQGVMSFDGLYTNVVSKPALLLTFDDASDTVYDEAFSRMRQHNIPGTFYVVTGSVGGGGQVTSAELLEMQATGWIIANHTQSHVDLTTLAEGDVVIELNAAKTDLTGWGITGDGPDHVAYPGGAHNATVLSAMATYGALTGRTVQIPAQGAIGWYQVLPFDHLPYQLWRAKEFGNTLTLAQAKSWVDTIISNKQFGTALFHTLVASPASATQWGIDDFAAFITYLVQKRVPCITIDQAYSLHSGSVRCALPV